MNHEIGRTLAKKGLYKGAISIFKGLIKKKPNDLRAYFHLGKIYYELNDLKKSIFFYRKCNQIQPNTPSILFNLALVLQSLGKIKESKKNYLKLISINSHDIKSYYALFVLDINNIDSYHYQKLKSLLNNDKISLFEKSLINYMLSKFEKNKDNFESEVNYLTISHEQCYASNLDYNNQSNFYYKKIIPNYYNKIKFQRTYDRIKKLNETNAIFIVGLPRSGSTLVETIISHNSENVQSFGEFHAINQSILEQIGSIIYSKEFNLKNFEFILDKRKIQDSLLERYQNFNKDILLDKSLENFFNIDIILEFFPNAKFLHTYRDPNDAIIGIHQRMMPDLSWSHSICDITEYTKNYDNIINFFKNKYPSKILDIELNKLTNEKEIQAKRILDFCNIKFESNYLDFYKNKKLFNKTNSFLQVRDKIKKYKSHKYQHYYYLLEKSNNA
jgi:tetratricopeptide (TPR) repeat protein